METTYENNRDVYNMRSFHKKLNKFEDLMRDITYRDAEATSNERRQWMSENLRFDQFCEKIRKLFGSDVKTMDIKYIYNKISANPDAKVDWSELYGYSETTGKDEDLLGGEKHSIFLEANKKRLTERRDSVQCLKYVPELDCYMSCSQKGAISMWTAKLRLQSSVDINEPSWVTGCDYLPGLRRVSCCTERSIVLWDSRSKGKSKNIFVIKPIAASPQCMTCVSSSSSEPKDTILFGDDQGYVNLLTVFAEDLTIKNAKTNSRRSQLENYVIESGKLSILIVRRKLHDDWVVQLKYFPQLRCFASCSPSSSRSFVLEEVDKIFTANEDAQSLTIRNGINCFELCAHANIIATGGFDKIVRLWHPHIFSQPTGKLVGHLFPIIDIASNEKDQHFISLCVARVFRVWNIHTLTCLQVFTDNDGWPGGIRINTMIFDNVNERLLTGSGVIDSWPLNRGNQDMLQVPHTHDRPVVQVLLNTELNQVVSVCTESVIKVWEMDTGRLVYSIVEAHGPNMEITALNLDTSGFRMVSGAFDGSIKVWDTGAGQVLKTKKSHTFSHEVDTSITGIVYIKCEDDYFIITSGWNDKLKLYLDARDSSSLVLLREFSDFFTLPQEQINGLMGSSRKLKNSFSSADPLPPIGQPDTQGNVLVDHEITCMTLITSDLLATGCSNGNIILWSIKKFCIEKIFILPRQTEHNDQLNRGRQDRHVNDIKFLVHKSCKLHPEYFRNDTDRWTESSRYHVSGEPERPDRNHTDTSQMNAETNTALEDTEVKAADEKGDDISELMPAMENSGHKMIVEAFEPILVSVHQDSFLRFWNMNGVILQEVSSVAHIQDVHVTSVCHDSDVNILITGDSKGYLTIWNVGQFLENPKTDDSNCLKQIICWRGHLKKVVRLVYVDALKVILSGSLDGSVRVWWGVKGKYVGFFGQYQTFHIPTSEDISCTLVLPSDIHEGPVNIEKKNASHKIQPVEKFEYPLVFDKGRWEPFRRSAYNARKDTNVRPKKTKFFGALIKPKTYCSHLESCRVAERTSGAVFRSLPIYRICTPERLRTSDISFKSSSYDDDEIRDKNKRAFLPQIVQISAKHPNLQSTDIQQSEQSHSPVMSVRGRNHQTVKLPMFSPLSHATLKPNFSNIF